jgi:hypothetical protein
MRCFCGRLGPKTAPTSLKAREFTVFVGLCSDNRQQLHGQGAHPECKR